MITYEKMEPGIIICHEEPQDCIVRLANGRNVQCTRVGARLVPTGFGYAITPIFACSENDAKDIREFWGM